MHQRISRNVTSLLAVNYFTLEDRSINKDRRRYVSVWGGIRAEKSDVFTAIGVRAIEAINSESAVLIHRSFKFSKFYNRQCFLNILFLKAVCCEVSICEIYLIYKWILVIIKYRAQWSERAIKRMPRNKIRAKWALGTWTEKSYILDFRIQ